MTASRSACRGRTGARARTSTRQPGCGRPHRAAPRSTKTTSPGRASSGTASGRPSTVNELTEEIFVATDAAQADDPEEQVLHGVDAQTHGEVNPQGHPHVGEGDVHT